MSITDLPPLPKSLSGFNKMLGSDSGLLSDADAKIDKIDNSNKFATQMNNSNNNNNNYNNNINGNSNNSDKINDGNNNDSGIDQMLSQELKESDNENQVLETTTTTTTTGATTATTNTTLDMQLATLKKEMYGLRQLDLSLLSQLWALNDSIQEFRTILQEQEQENDSYSPHSPTPSSYDSVSSDGEDVIISNKKKPDIKPKVITTQPKLLKSKSIEDPSTPTRMETINTSVTTTTPLKHQKPPAPLPKPHVPPVPRMRSAPPPPPTHSKSPAPVRPT